MKLTLQPHQLTKLLQRFTQKELADILEVNEKTIRRKLKLSNLSKQKQGRKRIFNQELLPFLRLHATYCKINTQKFMAWYFSLYLKRSINQSTICRSLKRAKVVWKGFTYQSIEQLRQKNQEKIKYFIELLIPFLLQSNTNIFFLDECSFRLNLAPRRGYSDKGLRLIGQKPGNKGKNQTLILLTQISNGEKIIYSKLIEGGVNSEKFHKFLSDFNPSNNGKKNVLIMDNLSVHKSKDSCVELGLSTIEELLKSKNIIPIFLPSYTPELNPVEKIFNIIRRYAEEKQARKKDKLDLIIKEKLEVLQKENLIKYLDSSIKECLMKNTKTVKVHSEKIKDPLYGGSFDWWDGSWFPLIPKSACWVEISSKRLEDEGWVRRYPC